MKRLILIFTVIAIGCSDSKVKDAIKNYEETIDGVKTDLNFKFISLNKTSIVTGNDSLSFYFEKYKHEFVDSVSSRMTIDSMINRYKIIVNNNKDFTKMLEDSLKKQTLPEFKNLYIEYINKNKETRFKDSSNLETLLKYKKIGNHIIGYKYLCCYSIVNPLLNNAKQEIKKVYLISADESKVLGIMDKK